MSRKKASFQETPNRVMQIIKRGVRSNADSKPRHGVHYRGPLSRLLRELRGLLYCHGSASATCERAISAKTRRERRVVMRRMLIDLFQGGLKLGRLSNFRGKHARAILSHWVERGLATSTMSTYVSHLRVFVTWLGKAELVKLIDQYCEERPGLTRRESATRSDKSERGAGVNFDEIRRRAVETGDVYFACQLLLIKEFGLRVREAFEFRPNLAVNAEGRVEITRGTKGGRPRELITPLTDAQRAALEQARALVPHRAGSMIPSHYVRSKDWSAHFYHQCRRIGLTRKQLGVTPHSLRHGALLDLYEGLAGVPAPVRRVDDASIDPAVDRACRRIVTRNAGHSRLHVASAYLGSPRRRVARPRVETNPPTEGPPDLGASKDEGTSSDEGP
jgi:integrase